MRILSIRHKIRSVINCFEKMNFADRPITAIHILFFVFVAVIVLMHRPVDEAYTECILEHPSKAVTEKLIMELSTEIKRKRLSNDEVCSLARTLAYVKK